MVINPAVVNAIIVKSCLSPQQKQIKLNYFLNMVPGAWKWIFLFPGAKSVQSKFYTFHALIYVEQLQNGLIREWSKFNRSQFIQSRDVIFNQNMIWWNNLIWQTEWWKAKRIHTNKHNYNHQQTQQQSQEERDLFIHIGGWGQK